MMTNAHTKRNCNYQDERSRHKEADGRCQSVLTALLTY
jgi:hypothetical protein